MNSSTLSSSHRKCGCDATEIQVDTFLFFSHLTGHSSLPHPLPPPKKEQIRGNTEQAPRPQSKRSMRSQQQTWCSCSGRSNLGYRIETFLLETLLRAGGNKDALKKKYFFSFFPKTSSQTFWFYLFYPNKKSLLIYHEMQMNNRGLFIIPNKHELLSGIKWYSTKP